MTLPCTACHRTDVPPWDLHIRSVTFRQVAWCDPCWQARPVIPAQRPPAGETLFTTHTGKA